MAGKLAILFVFLLLVTCVPAMLLLLVQIGFAGSFTFVRQNLYLVPAITLFSLVQVLLASCTMLALSSLSNSSRFVGIMYAGLIFFTGALFNAVRGITGTVVAGVAVADRRPRAARRRDLPAAAALRPAGVGVGAGRGRPHRRLAAGARTPGPRRRGGALMSRRRSSSAEHLSKWYGQVIGLNDVTVSMPPGITGLLGPNGAGKSTFMKLMTGQLKPSQGTIRVLGHVALGHPEAFARIGFCPEQDAFYDRMTGLEWVTALVRLNGLADADARGRRRAGARPRSISPTPPTRRSAPTARACGSA